MPDSPNKFSQFWQELRRRKVVRVITVYAAAAFVILELVSIIVEPLKLPEWTLSFIIVLLCVGLIIAIILSWIYDIHPEGGVVKTEPTRKGPEVSAPPSSKGWKIASYISFVVIIGLVVLNIIPRNVGSKGKEIREKSIAVLPFINDSPDEEQMYFINGLMESIIDNLCKIEDLRVPGRTSVEQYRVGSKPIPVIAKELNVSYVLEGSGQKLGNRVLLTIQLLDGKKDQHLWSRQYDREILKVEDLIDIQSEIAQLVAEEIEAIVTPEEKQLIEKIPTTSQTAYEFYQKGGEELWGKYFYSGRSNLAALQRAEDLYRYALEYDSAFAWPYVDIAWVYFSYYERDFDRPAEFLDSIRIYLEYALSYDDQSSSAYGLRGYYHRMIGEFDKALEDFNKTLELNPNSSLAQNGKAWLSWFNNDLVGAIENFHKSILVYSGPTHLRYLSQAYSNAGFKEQSNYYSQQALELDGDSALYYYESARAELLISNNKNKAISLLERAYAIDSINLTVLQALAADYLFNGQHLKSLSYYEKYIDLCNAIGIEEDIYSKPFIGLCFWLNGYKEKANLYFDQQVKFCEDMIILGSNDILAWHRQLAEIFSLRGEKEKAYEHLRIINQQVRMSINDTGAFTIERAFFDSIRDEPEFQQIVRDVETKYQTEHERVRQWLEENDML